MPMHARSTAILPTARTARRERALLSSPASRVRPEKRSADRSTPSPPRRAPYPATCASPSTPPTARSGATPPAPPLQERASARAWRRAPAVLAPLRVGATHHAQRRAHVPGPSRAGWHGANGDGIGKRGSSRDARASLPCSSGHRAALAALGRTLNQRLTYRVSG
jgi:hypothetical protein